jgi:hypothetical protein
LFTQLFRLGTAAALLLLAPAIRAATGDTSGSFTASAWRWITTNVEAVPEYHVDADMRWFYNRDSDYYHTHYFIESTIRLELLLVSVIKRGFAGCTFEVWPGMGQTPRNVVFDPMDISYAWVPFLEGRFGPVIAQVGVDHRCFHEVDRKDFPTVYWNQLFFAAQSPAFRYKRFWQSDSSAPSGVWERLSWQVQWGYFLRRFGSVKPSNVNYENYNVHEAGLRLRYRLWRTRRFGASILGHAKAGLWRNEAAPGETERGYWRLEFSPEAAILGDRHGWVFFFLFTLDDIPPARGVNNGIYRGTLQPRFSRDRLVQFGVRMFL